jgi:anti-sigma B factor antagonist
MGYNACHWALERVEAQVKFHTAWEKLRREVVVGLQISTRESGDVTILNIVGKATIGRDNDLLDGQLRKLVDEGVRKLLLNLADATQVDSSSISTIVRTFVTVERSGGSLKLLRPSGRVRVVLELMGLLRAIPSFEDEGEALASFRPRGYSAGADG